MVLAVVQARMSSSRLPGKVLADVGGRPMILRQLERVQAAKSVDRVIVATSTDTSDDGLASELLSQGVEVYRGSLADVLARYLDAAHFAGADRLLRLTADCPLTDPDVIDAVVEAHGGTGADYASNVITRTYPRGLDVEIVTTEALERVASLADAEEREHVTLGIYRRPEVFRLVSVTQAEDRSSLRWTVDLPSDLDFVRAVYDALSPISPTFRSSDIYDLLDRRPELNYHEGDQS